MALTLVIGNKNYSSWSMRPWLALKVAGIAFQEIVIPLYEPGSRERMLAWSPTGKVPALADGERRIWESLAIIEYLAEKFPEAGLWPADPGARAHARAVAAEMHGGFSALRRQYPMNMRRQPKRRELSPEAQAEVRRIEALWTDCRIRFGGGERFLFGSFCAADAMYAPVVARMYSYSMPVGSAAERYKQAIMALPAWQEWRAAALVEPWVMPQNELD
jgi:glutathione S-transferase